MSQAEGAKRVAVVLCNLGGPDSLKAVRPFLFNLFRDPAIIEGPALFRLALAALISTTRAPSARKNYALMGGASPLLQETGAQARELAARLSEADIDARVFIAMRYWRPTFSATARAVQAFAPDEVVILPLYPQFAGATTGSAMEAWAASYRGPGRVKTICCYPDEAGLVEAHARQIEKTYEAAGKPPAVRILFSAHGLPEKSVAGGDPYQWQIEKTARAVAERLKTGPCAELEWQICYQSRVGPLKWLSPYTPQAIEAAGHEGLGVLISPIAFVSEHVETLVELDRDYAETAEVAGCPVYLRAPTLGVEPAFIDGLAKIVLNRLADDLTVESACGGRLCPMEWKRCPVATAAAAAPALAKAS